LVFGPASLSFSDDFRASLLSFSGISQLHPKSRKAKQGSVPSCSEQFWPEKLSLFFMASKKKGFIPDEEGLHHG
jgi:hypothetical protein